MPKRTYKQVERVSEAVPDGTPVEHSPAPDDLGYESIPKSRYTSDDYMHREWTHMWSKVWLLAGQEHDLAEPGDFISTTIGRESVIVVKQADGGVKAFFNVCMHRGNRLTDEGIDNTESFKCSYHGWEYGLDGKFVNIPDAELYPQGKPCSGLIELP